MIQRQPVPRARMGGSWAASARVATAQNVAPEFVLAAQLAARLGRCTARLVPRLATAAMRLSRIEGWKPLGFTCANDFARERLDHSGSWLRQLARLGRTIQGMPALQEAITGEDGGNPLGRAAAYEICRVARPGTVADWIQRARSCTIRDLKELVRRAQVDQVSRNTGSSSDAAIPRSHHLDALQMPLPVFVRGSLQDVERVFLATNPGSRRQDLLDAVIAEQASRITSGMIDVGDAGPTGSRHLVSQHLGSRPRLRVLPGAPGAIPEVARQDNDASLDQLDERTTNRDLLPARWTLHRVDLFIESLPGDSATDGKAARAVTMDTAGSADTTAGGVAFNEHLEQCMRDILSLEHEVKLRLDALLLWLDHRRAWSLLGFADAAEFGQRVLEESASTTRNRLRLARAMERSLALRHSAESGRLSHQRLVRLVQLMEKNMHMQSRLNERNEMAMRQWVDRSVQVQVKRLDEDLDVVERRRWVEDAAEPVQGSSEGHSVPGFPGVGVTRAAPGDLPLPPSDAEWQASLRLVPGEARRRLLLGGLKALAEEPPVNVCHRFTGSAETIRDLRHALNMTRVRLAEQGRRLVDARGSAPGTQSLAGTPSPSDESRLFPSIRLAARHVERGTPIPDWICLLSLLEEFAEEYDNPRNMPRRPTDAIAARDGWRCTAPGCTSRQIEVHHIVYRSHGGSDDPSNLTSLCPFHHRMGEHGGLLKVTGKAPLNLRWQIGGRVYINERLVSGPAPTSQTDADAI